MENPQLVFDWSRNSYADHWRGASYLLILCFYLHNRTLTYLHSSFNVSVTSTLITGLNATQEEMSGRHVMFGPCFVQLSLIFQTWSQTSEQICKIFIENKFLVDYIRVLKGSNLSRDTKVSYCVKSTELNLNGACGLGGGAVKLVWKIIKTAASAKRFSCIHLCINGEGLLYHKGNLNF